MPMDPNVTSSKGQYPSSLAEIVKTKNLPCREGIEPLTHTPKPDGTFPIAIDAGGAMLLDAAKCDLQGLERKGNISLVSGDEENHLPGFGDAGEAPQHKKVGYMPMVDKGLVSWTPKKQEADAILTMEAEEDDAAMVGIQMWLRGPGNAFWELFPLLININKRPPKIYKQTYQQHSQTFTHTLGFRSD